jgi:hypothetical protein
VSSEVDLQVNIKIASRSRHACANTIAARERSKQYTTAQEIECISDLGMLMVNKLLVEKGRGDMKKTRTYKQASPGEAAEGDKSSACDPWSVQVRI